MLIEVTEKKLKPGNVIYCSVDNIYSKVQKTVCIDHEHKSMMLIKTSWINRYQELDVGAPPLQAGSR